MSGPIFSCCYCDDVLTDDVDWRGVSLYDKDSGDLQQAWFCHETCFRAALHPGYNVVPGDDDFPEDPYEEE